MKSVAVEQRFMPLLYVRYTGRATDDDFDAYLEVIERSMYGTGASKRVLLLDATDAEPVSAKQRQKQAAWQKQHYDRIQMLTVGIAFVIPSTLIRGIMTAIFWLQSLPCPHQVFATRDEALEWCAKQLAPHGLQIPLGARAAVARASIAPPS